MRFRRVVSHDAVAALVIFLVVWLFLHSAFFPLSVFISGDVGGSDFSDFFLPLKVLLGQALKAGQLPLWAAKVGFGYPFLAEGSLQTFFPTTILSLFFSPPLAFNLSLALTIFCLGFFTYLFLHRSLKISSLSSLFAALSFTFSAPLIMRWKHPSILGVVALLPLELWLIAWFFQINPSGWGLSGWGLRKSAGFIAALAALVGLQLWSGHPQVAAYCLVAVSLYFLCQATVVFFAQKNLKILLPYLLALGLGLGLGAVQLFPSLELKQLSLRSRPLSYAQSREYPFYFEYLVTYLSPFFYGDPSDLAPDKEFIYPTLVWEICLYCGLAAGVFGLLAFPNFFREKKLRFWVILFLFSVIQSGTNFLYFVPGFSSFRVPSRFGIIATLSLTILAAYTVEKLFSGRKQFKIIGALLICLAVGDLYYFLGTYNQTVPANRFIEPPSSAAFLKSHLGSQRFYTLGSYYLANNVYFSQRGWRDYPENYLDVRAGLMPNTSILWDLRGADLYSGLTLERPGSYLNALEKSFAIDFPKNEVTPSAQTKRLFSFGAIKYLVTPLNLVGDQDFKLVNLALAVRDWVIRIYEYQNSLPRAYFTSRVKVVDSQVGAETELFYKGQEDSLTTILEKVPNMMVPDQKPSKDKPEVDIIVDEDQKVVVKVIAPQPGYLVLSDTYYPGWRAYLEDKTEVRIVRANYNFRAVPLLAGDHTVTFIYQPESFLRGLRISLASLGIIFGLLVYWQLGRPWSPHQKLDKPQEASLL